MWEWTHVVFRLVNSYEEEQLCYEKVDAKVLVDGVAVSLQTTQEAESWDADGQTHQRDDNSHPGDHKQDKLVHPPLVLWSG